MLPTKNNDMLNLNEGTSTHAMSIDADSSEFLMGILTDLYKFKVNAVIREYSTNAQDATKAAGSTEPIQVILPSPANLFFTVRDFGTGMSHQDIIDIYSKYGASQSRNSNDVTGMLGLGSKSALTYTSSFTVDTVKDGERIIATISKTNTVPTIEILARTETDLPSGTTIKVPVGANDVFQFEQVAEEIYSYWADPILVNGKAPTPFWEINKWTQIDDDVWFNHRGTGSYLVQGNVAYPVSYSLARSGGFKGSFVAYVPNGTVDFTPAREEMRDTDLTLSTIASAIEFVEGRIAHLTRNVASMEAIEILDLGHQLGWHNMPESAKFTFSGIGTTYKDIHLAEERTGQKWIESSILSYDPKGFYVKGFKAKRVTKTHAERFRLHINKHNLSTAKNAKVFILTDAEAEEIDFENIIFWEDVEGLKRGSTGSTSLGKGYDYDVWTESGLSTVSGIIESDSIVYGHKDELSAETIATMLERDDSLTIVPLAKNRMNKFVRLHPEAMSLEAWATEERAKFIAEFSDEDKTILKAHKLRNSLYWRQSQIVNSMIKLVDQLNQVNFDTELVAFFEALNKSYPNIPFFVHSGDLYTPYPENFLEDFFADEKILLMSRLNDAEVDSSDITEFMTWKFKSDK